MGIVVTLLTPMSATINNGDIYEKIFEIYSMFNSIT